MRRSICAGIAATGALAALLLGGCGGRGVGAQPSPLNSYDLQAAMSALVASGESTAVSFSGAAIVGGAPQTFTGTGSLTLSPGKSGLFNAATAQLQSETVSGTITAAGQATAYSRTVVRAYDPATGAIVGQTAGAEVDVAEAPLLIPTAVDLAPMMLGTLVRYADSTLSVPIGSITVSVALEAIPVDPGTVELVQFTYSVYDSSRSLIETDVDSYTLSADSLLQFNSASTQSAQGTLTIGAQ